MSDQTHELISHPQNPVLHPSKPVASDLLEYGADVHAKVTINLKLPYVCCVYVARSLFILVLSALT